MSLRLIDILVGFAMPLSLKTHVTKYKKETVVVRSYMGMQKVREFD